MRSNSSILTYISQYYDYFLLFFLPLKDVYYNGHFRQNGLPDSMVLQMATLSDFI